MDSISVRTGGGALCAVAAVILLTITAIAIAAIFAPPFFATALLAGIASHVAIGCAIASIAAGIAALVLLYKNPTIPKVKAAEPEKDMDSTINAYLSEMNDMEWPEDFYGDNFVNLFTAKLKKAKNHPQAAVPPFKTQLEEVLKKIDLDSVEGANCDNAETIRFDLVSLIERMDNVQASDPDSTESESD